VGGDGRGRSRLSRDTHSSRRVRRIGHPARAVAFVAQSVECSRQTSLGRLSFSAAVIGEAETIVEVSEFDFMSIYKKDDHSAVARWLRRMTDQSTNRLNELLRGDPESESSVSRLGFLKSEGLSVEQFARKLGVSRTMVYFYLEDHSRPTAAALHKICEEVGITYEKGLTYCTPRTSGGQTRSR
jgi:DNA-binding phage protein